ncbi:DUF3159 domain-containing protein [Corynebacterium ammoniagenes]|uniref:DUF3159 domain-containing protein n=1 Tax=Corynebacterium ammoniagenes TaxID=1697 RepID=A0AAV5G6Q0_CORAM|nr:hypothetical protein CAT723_08270 [Corynebacterium ammoniagenes]
MNDLNDPIGKDSAGSAAAHPSGAQDSAQSKVKAERKPIEEQTLLEQMGGWQGLVSTTLPIVVLVPVNSKWGLGPALIAALAVALVILVWRVVRKETIQPAISGFLGVAFCAAIAWFTGDAKGYFLYGIWASLVFAVVALASVLFKWPAVGVIWKGINGEDMMWQRVTPARRAYAIATLGWVVIFVARFIVQNNLYNSSDTTTLGIVRILMGWPLTGVVTALTVWMVRRANKAIEVAVERGDIVPKAEKPTGDSEASDANSHESADHAAETINDGDQNQ